MSVFIQFHVSWISSSKNHLLFSLHDKVGTTIKQTNFNLLCNWQEVFNRPNDTAENSCQLAWGLFGGGGFFFRGGLFCCCFLSFFLTMFSHWFSVFRNMSLPCLPKHFALGLQCVASEDGQILQRPMKSCYTCLRLCWKKLHLLIMYT